MNRSDVEAIVKFVYESLGTKEQPNMARQRIKHLTDGAFNLVNKSVAEVMKAPAAKEETRDVEGQEYFAFGTDE
jgi:hypothetical protein